MASTGADIAQIEYLAAVYAADRLDALEKTGLLDTQPEPAFDRLTQLACRLLRAPVSLVSLVDQRRQFFKSAQGLPEPWATRRETPLSHSFCKYVVASGQPLRVEDARDDALVKANHAVPELGVVAYLGTPLQTEDGQVLGSFCVIDGKPRSWSEEDLENLQMLARSVTAEITLKRELALRQFSEEIAVGQSERALLLSRAVEGILRASDIGTMLADLFTVVSQHLRLDIYFHYTLNSAGSLSLIAHAGISHEAAQSGAMLAFGEAVYGHVAQSHMPFHATHIQKSSDPLVGFVRDLGLDCYACTPLLAGDTLLGTLGFGRRCASAFTEEELTFIRTICNYVTVARVRQLAEAALRRSEERQAFLLTLGDRLRREDDSAEIKATAAEMLGRHLNAGRVGYAEATDSNFTFAVEREWTDGWMPGMAGSYSLTAFGTDLIDGFSRGETMQIRDVETDARMTDYLPAFRAVGFSAGVSVPLVKNGTFAAALYVHQAAPRHWLDDEISLVEDVAERTWDAVERARAERGLRQLNETLEERVVEEVTERQRAEDDLRQAQKMEAVGQLTGGIAHDFNNMLTGILGSLDLLKRRIAGGKLDNLEKFIDAATSSADRAAGLTHRLLAFARRQSLDPKPVDVNALIGAMEDLLHRTLGENITLDIRAADDLWLAFSDFNQLESALLNLVINARDAMPQGGALTIKTANTRLEAAKLNADNAGPGDYVSISVSDTGCGMSPAVIARVFEPFFTTKPIGKGTGLGLSMLYGFVKQSGGHVTIDSEPGAGTAMRLLLPRGYPETNTQVAALASLISEGAGETVLVVEDDAAVRMLVTEVLRDLGYAALEAQDGTAALPLLSSNARIDLLVTDVGLPGVNGRQVAEYARHHRPALPVLFVTGYAEHATTRSEFLDEGMGMITKPFAMDLLAAKIREMIASRSIPEDKQLISAG